jgi:hypothetical protein
MGNEHYTPCPAVRGMNFAPYGIRHGSGAAH